MSGGSYDYAYQKVDEVAESLEHSTIALRRAFAAHLRLVSKAMHDIEWVDSCDYGKGDDEKSIQAVLGEGVHVAVMDVLVNDAKSMMIDLREAIAAASTTRKEATHEH